MNKIFQSKNVIGFMLVVVSLFGQNLISEGSYTDFSDESAVKYTTLTTVNPDEIDNIK